MTGCGQRLRLIAFDDAEQFHAIENKFDEEMIPVKSARHQAILDLIEQHPIDRQEDLLAHLREEGFDVTQATVSRDIRELQLVKTSHR